MITYTLKNKCKNYYGGKREYSFKLNVYLIYVDFPECIYTIVQSMFWFLEGNLFLNLKKKKSKSIVLVKHKSEVTITGPFCKECWKVLFLRKVCPRATMYVLFM